jgi:hypothetical protein
MSLLDEMQIADLLTQRSSQRLRQAVQTFNILRRAKVSNCPQSYAMKTVLQQIRWLLTHIYSTLIVAVNFISFEDAPANIL